MDQDGESEEMELPKKKWRVGADAEDVKRETAIKGDALFGSLYGFP